MYVCEKVCKIWVEKGFFVEILKFSRFSSHFKLLREKTVHVLLL
jgi:hypothetical protein